MKRYYVNDFTSMLELAVFVEDKSFQDERFTAIVDEDNFGTYSYRCFWNFVLDKCNNLNNIIIEETSNIITFNTLDESTVYWR